VQIITHTIWGTGRVLGCIRAVAFAIPGMRNACLRRSLCFRHVAVVRNACSWAILICPLGFNLGPLTQ
jgi:hypothetical protein